MLMAKLDQRVNIRLDSDTYEAYAKVADFFNRSVPDVMRESLQAGAEIMHMLGVIIDQAKAGDTEAVQKLFDAFWKMQRGQLELAELQTTAITGEKGSAGASNTAL